MKHKANAQLAKASHPANCPQEAIAPSPPPNKPNTRKRFKGDADDRDRFLTQVQEVFATDNAHYILDLDTFYFAAGLLEDRGS